MIYTVTFNPSLDYIVTVQDFTVGKVNRTKKELVLPGGKGINVSIVLKNLGMASTALGFVAGFTGEEIKRRLAEQEIDTDFIMAGNGMSRINVKLRSNEESEINGIGPDLDEASLSQFMAKIDLLKDGDVLVLAGSIPAVLPETIYRDIMKRLQGKNIMIAVDATKDLLCNVLEYHPFVIKPNNFELGEIFGVELTSREEVVTYAKKLQERGARNVLVSMAGDGAVLVAEDGTTYQSPAPKGKVVNSVGAGDSMVAGFIYGYLTEQNYENAFYTGISCGSASAFSENLATKEEVEAVYRNLAKNVTN
ncbi:MAG: 1-phosphofructokinase [Clostridium sp.]|nr:1-phosphofructokinase [Clostridium sp.]